MANELEKVIVLTSEGPDLAEATLEYMARTIEQHITYPSFTESINTILNSVGLSSSENMYLTDCFDSQPWFEDCYPCVDIKKSVILPNTYYLLYYGWVPYTIVDFGSGCAFCAE